MRHRNLMSRVESNNNEDIISKWDFFILIIILSAIGIYIYKDYLFFEKVFIFTGYADDTIRQFFVDFYFRSERLFSGNFSFWSFRHDLGMNVYPLIANLNPFDILIILFGKHNLSSAIVYSILLKLVISGVFFFFFLKKLKLSAHAAIIGSMLFAYSGFSMINGHWYHYLNYAVFTALMLLLFEQWFQDGKWILMVLAIGLASIKGILQLYQLVFFFMIYGLFRITQEYGFDIKKIISIFARFYLLFALGILLGAFYILPELYQAISSSRGGESIYEASMMQWLKDLFSISNSSHIKTFLFRYISNDILGSFERFKGVSNYLESPAAYVGLISLIVIPILFFQVHGRKKAAFIILVSVCLLYFFFPYVKVIGNAFASGTYKHTIMYNSIMMIILASWSLDILFKEDANHKDILYIPIFFLFGLLVSTWFSEKIYMDRTIVLIVMGFLLMYSFLLLFIYHSHLKPYLKTILIFAVMTELALFGTFTVSRSSRPVTKGFIERGELYFDKNTLQAIDYIKKTDTGFYRVEKSYQSVHLNDAVVQGYYGTSAYYGFSSMPIVDFHRTMGLSRSSPRLASYRYGLSKRNKLQSLLNVKYYLTHGITDVPIGFVRLKTFGNVHVFKNQNTMPFGFVYQKYISRSEFAALSSEEKDKVLLNYFVTDQHYPNLKNVGRRAAIESEIQSKEIDKFSLTDLKENKIKGRIQIKNDGMLFFSIPYSRGWKVKVNGIKVNPKLINIAFIGLPLEKGEYEIWLQFIPPYLYLGIIISLISMILTIFLYKKRPRLHAIDLRN
ncbi:MAG TPA: hypothetical protein ENI07_22425 [Desulfobacterales bacterium]|nr:hypothetical protein [Desulfobacterales bacterium]